MDGTPHRPGDQGQSRGDTLIEQLFGRGAGCHRGGGRAGLIVLVNAQAMRKVSDGNDGVLQGGPVMSWTLEARSCFSTTADFRVV